MRKILVILAALILVILAIAIAWIGGGPKIALFVDRFGRVEASSQPVQSIHYEGYGTGGTLYLNQISLSLDDPVPPLQPPSVGSTKEGQLALAFNGKVFPFGPLPKTGDSGTDILTTAPQKGDTAQIIFAHSPLSWPTPLEMNFMTGTSPSWKRYQYYRLRWSKPNGAKLEMLWRYQQYLYPSNGWTTGMMTEEHSTGLIGIDIHR